MSDIRVLFVTIGPDQADQYVRALCRERLVACGNILPGVRSHYWWEGEVQSDEEAVVLMETSAERLDDAMRRAQELHPYDVPKIIAFDPEAVHAPYADWAIAQTRPTNTD